MIARPMVPPAVSAVAVPKGRASFGFGPRFFLLLVGGALIAVPAWLDGRVLWVLALWNIVVMAVWWTDLKRMPAHESVRVTRTWRTPLSLGIASEVSLVLRNETGSSLDIEVIDDAPVELRSEFARNIVSLAPGEQKTTTYSVLPQRRGDLPVGSAWLRLRTPWAVAERWMRAELGQAVRVYPDLVAARQQSLLLLRSRQVSLEKRRARAAGRGREFDSLRDYQPGDELRDIAWPVTARRGKLITRVYQPERSQAVWILVDGGRLLRARVGERTKLDLLVDAALALAQVVEGSGDRVGLLTYGRSLHQRLAPARGSQHLRQIFEALATVSAERAEANHAAAASALMSAQKQRALVVWLTELAETAGVPDVVEHAMTLSPRHLVLFGVMKPADLEAAAAAVPASPIEMYRLLAAQETLDRRDVLLRGLTHRGAHVVQLDRQQSTAMLIDPYLLIKERSLI